MSRAAPDNATAAAGASFNRRMRNPDHDAARQMGPRGRFFNRNRYLRADSPSARPALPSGRRARASRCGRRGCRGPCRSARSRPSSRAGAGPPTGGPCRGRAAAARRGCARAPRSGAGCRRGLLKMMKAVVGRTSMLEGSLASSSTRLWAALPISLWNSASSSATAAGSRCGLARLVDVGGERGQVLLGRVVHGLIDGGGLERARGVPQLAERHLLQDQRAASCGWRGGGSAARPPTGGGSARARRGPIARAGECPRARSSG